MYKTHYESTVHSSWDSNWCSPIRSNVLLEFNKVAALIGKLGCFLSSIKTKVCTPAIYWISALTTPSLCTHSAQTTELPSVHIVYTLQSYLVYIQCTDCRATILSLIIVQCTKARGWQMWSCITKQMLQGNFAWWIWYQSDPINVTAILVKFADRHWTLTLYFLAGTSSKYSGRLQILISLFSQKSGGVVGSIR